MEILGMPPQQMLDQGRKTRKYFVKIPSKGTYEPKKSDKGIEYDTPGSRTLEDVFKEFHGSSDTASRKTLGLSGRDFDKFQDLILKMLQFDPKKRITPRDALGHKFFTSRTVARSTIRKSVPVNK